MWRTTRSLGVVILLCVCACAGAKREAPPPQHAAAPPPPPVAAPAVLGHPRGDLIPRVALYGNPERTNVQVSPDGKLLSWLAPSNNVLNVWVAPLDALDQAKPITADKTRPVREYYWTHDGQHLLYLQDVGGDENFHVYRVTTASGEVLDITPFPGARAQILGLSEREPNLVMVGVNDRDKRMFDVHRVDLRTGERSLVALNDQGFAGFVFDADLGLRLAAKLPPDGSLAYFKPDRAMKTWQEYDRIPVADAMSTSFNRFDRTGKGLYAVDSRGRNTGALVRIDFDSKRPSVLFEDARADVTGIMTHPTEHTVQAVSIEYTRPQRIVLDKRIQPDLDGIDKLDPDAGWTEIVSRTTDDKLWIVEARSERKSTHYYRWDRARQQGTFLFSQRPALDAQPLVKMHPVVIPSRDQLPLVSYLSLPREADRDEDGKPEAPLPLVLAVHGGPWGRDQWGFNRHHQLLANRGYAVLSVNFRGSTGFGKEFVNRGDRQWGKKMHEDLLDAVAWAIRERVAPADKICIAGGSYGGYATLAGLALTPDVFACGVDIVGPSSIVTLIDTIPPYWEPLIAVFHARVGDPNTEEGKRALLEVSPLTHAAEIARPLLIAQGANDPRVKKSESDQIVHALQSKQIPVGYIVFPDEGHGFARPENNVAFTALEEAFLSVHLGGYYQPLSDEELKASTLTIEAGKETLPELPPRG